MRFVREIGIAHEGKVRTARFDLRRGVVVISTDGATYVAPRSRLLVRLRGQRPRESGPNMLRWNQVAGLILWRPSSGNSPLQDLAFTGVERREILLTMTGRSKVRRSGRGDQVKQLESRVRSGRILSARRALLCLAAGVVAGLLTATCGPELGPIVGWCVAATCALAWVWLIGWHQDADGTERLAEEENRSRSTDLWVVLAAVASLAVVAVALQRSEKDPVAVATVLLSVVSVTLAWAMVNTVFA